MKKYKLSICYESKHLITGPEYYLSIFDNDADVVLQIFVDSLEVVELGDEKYLKCYRKGIACNLIYLNNIEHIVYNRDLVKYYTDLSIDTLKSILEKENMKND